MTELPGSLQAVTGASGRLSAGRWRGLSPRWASARPACAAALAVSDVAASVLSVSLAWLIVASGMVLELRPGLALTDARTHAALVEFAFISVGLVAYFTVQGHYHRRLPFWRELHQVLLAGTFAVFANGFMEFAFKTDASRILVFGTWIAFPFALVIGRQVTRRILKDAGLWDIRTLIVGTAEAAQEVSDALSSEPRLGYVVVGVISPSALTRIPENRSWMQLMHQSGADLIVMAPERGQSLTLEWNEALVREQLPFAVMPRAEGFPVSGGVQTYFFAHDLVMTSYRSDVLRPVESAAKLLIDVIGATCTLLFLLPVMVAIAVAVKLDGGPIFYSQQRVGAGGRLFACMKFRSMRRDSAAILRHVLATDSAAAVEWAATRKLRNDPRVTRVGAVLRKTSLDELPQLLNVLQLEMSLVGPRPIVEGEIIRYGSDIAYYYDTRPGLTGLWQVSGRSDTTYAQRVKLDTWYVKNWTLWHDVAILARTLPAVLKRTGAV